MRIVNPSVFYVILTEVIKFLFDPNNYIESSNKGYYITNSPFKSNSKYNYITNLEALIISVGNIPYSGKAQYIKRFPHSDTSIGNYLAKFLFPLRNGKNLYLVKSNLFTKSDIKISDLVNKIIRNINTYMRYFEVYLIENIEEYVETMLATNGIRQQRSFYVYFFVLEDKDGKLFVSEPFSSVINRQCFRREGSSVVKKLNKLYISRESDELLYYLHTIYNYEKRRFKNFLSFRLNFYVKNGHNPQINNTISQEKAFMNILKSVMNTSDQQAIMSNNTPVNQSIPECFINQSNSIASSSTTEPVHPKLPESNGGSDKTIFEPNELFTEDSFLSIKGKEPASGETTFDPNELFAEDSLLSIKGKESASDDLNQNEFIDNNILPFLNDYSNHNSQASNSINLGHIPQGNSTFNQDLSLNSINMRGNPSIIDHSNIVNETQACNFSNPDNNFGCIHQDASSSSSGLNVFTNSSFLNALFTATNDPRSERTNNQIINPFSLDNLSLGRGSNVNETEENINSPNSDISSDSSINQIILISNLIAINDGSERVSQATSSSNPDENRYHDLTSNHQLLPKSKRRKYS